LALPDPTAPSAVTSIETLPDSLTAQVAAPAASNATAADSTSMPAPRRPSLIGSLFNRIGARWR
jgi:hypothetical protein